MPHHPPDPESRAATILVVDDNEANRALAAAALGDEGYRVVLAGGGLEGIAAFEREQPDCILLDVRMPEVNGFMVCERVRSLPGGPETPILFLTALRDVETFDGALRAGGDDFLTKPIRPTELVVRVQSALKLRRMNVELREHYELLKSQRDALIRLQLQKERLTAFVIHDLKNPVSVMDLHAQLLLRDKELPGRARDSAMQIRTQARQLTRMILNLLDVSKADEGQLAPRRVDVDLRLLVDDVLAELSVNAQTHKVNLQSELEPERLHADADLFRRTLVNLVENAIRYAPAGSSITVTALHSDGGIELRVADTGSGIPVDMREKVFNPFVQVEAGEGVVARGGRGLGLTFCKVAIEAHGGRIWIEDGAPGAIFCMTIPHLPEAPRSAISSSPSIGERIH